MVTYFIRAVRWRFLLAPVGRPALRACFVTTVIGFMVNFLAPTGRLGELARPYLLARTGRLFRFERVCHRFSRASTRLDNRGLPRGRVAVFGGLPPEGARSDAAVHGTQGRRS